MKYAIIGGGVSGLTMARILRQNGQEAKVYERCSHPGGLIKCRKVNGSLFHCTGGHVFNTKRTDVNDWFWSNFDKEKEFIKAMRNSSIVMRDGNTIPYPIENHVFLLKDSEITAFIKDLIRISRSENVEPQNFEEFLQSRFGETLYQLYFQPYNYKVWHRDLKKIPLSWLEGKLPMPTIEEMIYNNVCHVKEQSFVHSSFYYPKQEGSQFIANRLSEGLNIEYNSPINIIEKKQDKFIINNDEVDRIIFTGNIKQLSTAFKSVLDLSAYSEAIANLEYHGTTSVFCKINKNPYSWIYLPDNKYKAHRIICTGNFSEYNDTDKQMTGTIEFTDYISIEEIKANLAKMPYMPLYLDHHYEEYTYPIQDKETRNMISALKKETEQQGIFLLGRFAEWEYYNMDAAMGAAIDLYRNKLSNLGH